MPGHLAERRQVGIPFILGRDRAQLADAVEAGEGLGDLRADRGNLDQRRGEQAGEEDVLEEVAARHPTREDVPPADDDQQRTDDADDHGREGGGGGDARHGGGDIPEELVGALREGVLLAAFGGVRLHHANAGDALDQSAGDLGVELAALAEDRPQPGEGVRHPAAENEEQDGGHRGEAPVEEHQPGEGDRGRHGPADELHQAGADQVADPFGVAHHARDELPGLGRVEGADRQADEVRLHGAAHLGDGALCRDAEDLRDAERRGGLHHGGGANGGGQRPEQRAVAAGDHDVDQLLRRPGEDEAGGAIDQHEHEADGQPSAVEPEQFPRFTPDHFAGDLLLLGPLADVR